MGSAFVFTGTPIDKTMQSTHRDFGPLKDGMQERYLSYYGIRREIRDGATLEVHYIRDPVPFKVDEEPLSVGFEQMCAEMELEDEEAKDFIQRQRSQWKELARHPARIEIVLEKMLTHFLEHPDPNGFKAQLVAVDRKASALYKMALELIDWDALRATVPREVARCMELFDGITIADTRECLLSALRRLRDADVAKTFEHNFKSLERLWEAVAPDPCLFPHRYQYNWFCSIYVAHRRRQRGSKDTYGELSAKTRQLIQENTTFIDLAEALPVFKIDKDYVANLDELPTPADKAAALEAILTAELSEDDPSFIYRQLASAYSG